MGSNEYVMHFAKNQTPPVKGFWSLTMHTTEMFFAENPLNKYTVSPREHPEVQQGWVTRPLHPA